MIPPIPIFAAIIKKRRSESNQNLSSNSRGCLVTLFLLLILTIGIAACRDQDPPPTLNEQLQGAWIRHWTPAQAVTTYSFDGHGQYISYAILPAQPVQMYAGAYTIDGDVLTMYDLAEIDGIGGGIRQAAVTFPTDTTCVLAWEGGVNYYLTRI